MTSRAQGGNPALVEDGAAPAPAIDAMAPPIDATEGGSANANGLAVARGPADAGGALPGGQAFAPNADGATRALGGLATLGSLGNVDEEGRPADAEVLRVVVARGVGHGLALLCGIAVGLDLPRLSLALLDVVGVVHGRGRCDRSSALRELGGDPRDDGSCRRALGGPGALGRPRAWA